MSNAITRRQLIGTGAAGLCTLALGGKTSGGRGQETAQRADHHHRPAAGRRDERGRATSGSRRPTWTRSPPTGCISRTPIVPYPLCSPSRSALHTGRTPHEIGVDHNNLPIDPKTPLSGQVFRAAGYDTGYAGKWHCPNSYPTDGIAGFEVLNKTTRTGQTGPRRGRGDDERGHRVPPAQARQALPAVVSFINPHDICLLAGETSPLLDEVWKRYQPPAGAELPPLPANFGDTQGLPAGIQSQTPP